MKNIAKILLLSLSIIALSICIPKQTNAQLRIKQQAPITKGSYGVFGQVGSTISGTGLTDTLAVSDTIADIIPLSGPNEFTPFISLGWTKIGTGTATVTVNIYQGNSPNNFNTVKAGMLNAAYTKTLTLSASGTSFIDFQADSAKVSGRYLKISYTTSSTASVQGSLVRVVNTLIR